MLLGGVKCGLVQVPGGMVLLRGDCNKFLYGRLDR